MQALFKSSMLNSSKSSLVRLYSTNRNMKSSSKNHYDTLKITPHATQNEVKSAYYKLTLQYHPDKNKSEYAKQKFQDISEAYEVLSNHESRKNYNQRMMLHQQPVTTTSQEPMSQYRDKAYSGTSKIYNFDEWTQAHYGRQMYRDRIRRNTYEQYKKMEMMKASERNAPRYTEYAMFFLIITAIAALWKKKVDVPTSKTEENYIAQSKENGN